MSESTEAYDFPLETLRDRGNKFFRDRQNPQLQDYVLVSSQEIAIDLYCKSSDGRWEIINYRAGDIVKLQSIDLSFPIEQVYRAIDFSEIAVESTTPTNHDGRKSNVPPSKIQFLKQFGDRQGKARYNVFAV